MPDTTRRTSGTGPSSSASRRLTYAGEILQELRRRILTGELDPGERIGELATAEEFNTSQGPVREALAALRAEGLLVRLGRRGTFVSKTSLPDAFAAYEMRIRIEPHVAAKAASLRDEGDLALLRADHQAMREMAAVQDLPGFVQHDMVFHGRLYEICGSPVYSRVWEAVRGSVQMFNTIFGPQLFESSELADLAQDHQSLFELLERRDTEELQAEIAAHLQQIWDRISMMSDEDA